MDSMAEVKEGSERERLAEMSKHRFLCRFGYVYGYVSFVKL